MTLSSSSLSLAWKLSMSEQFLIPARIALSQVAQTLSSKAFIKDTILKNHNT